VTDPTTISLLFRNVGGGVCWRKPYSTDLSSPFSIEVTLVFEVDHIPLIISMKSCLINDPVSKLNNSYVHLEEGSPHNSIIASRD
jgi:hypothetical protein